MVNGKNRDRRTICLGKEEIALYDQAVCDLGLSLSLLARTALKLLLLVFKNQREGGYLKLVHSNGTEERLIILELQGGGVKNEL